MIDWPTTLVRLELMTVPSRYILKGGYSTVEGGRDQDHLGLKDADLKTYLPKDSVLQLERMQFPGTAVTVFCEVSNQSPVQALKSPNREYPFAYHRLPPTGKWSGRASARAATQSCD